MTSFADLQERVKKFQLKIYEDYMNEKHSFSQDIGNKANIWTLHLHITISFSVLFHYMILEHRGLKDDEYILLISWNGKIHHLPHGVCLCVSLLFLRCVEITCICSLCILLTTYLPHAQNIHVLLCYRYVDFCLPMDCFYNNQSIYIHMCQSYGTLHVEDNTTPG